MNSADWTWTNRSAPANGPIQRQYPSMAFDSMRGKLMVFGGRSSVDTAIRTTSGSGPATDATLTNRTTGGTKPDARHQAGVVYDSKRDRLLMFSVTGTSDLRRPLGLGAHHPRVVADQPYRRAPDGALRPLDVLRPGRDKVFVFRANQGGYQNWEYDPALNTWKDRTVTSPPAGVSRSYFDVALDTTRGKIVMWAATTPASTTRTSGSGTRPRARGRS